MSVSNDNVAIYSIYTMLAVNDLACNAIKDIKPYVENKDKETKKIYRALLKRVKIFFTYTYKVIGDGSVFLSNYNEKIDELNDKDDTTLVKGVKYVLGRHKIQDDGLILKTIIATAYTEYSCANIRALCEKMKEEKIDCGRLDTWELKDIKRVMQNMYLWVTRKVPRDVLDEINQLVNPFITKIGLNIGNYDHFIQAYEYALKESK
jgi:hypothetical protein